MSESVEDRVKKVTSDVLKADVSAISASSRFTADLGAESIQSVELVAAFEEEFDIEMDEDDALGVQTVGDAVGFIEKCIAEQHGDS
jgi:acyl carrier protein